MPALLAGAGSAAQVRDSGAHPGEGTGSVRAAAEGEVALQGRPGQSLATAGEGRLDRLVAIGQRVELAAAPVFVPVRGAVESNDGGADVLAQPCQHLVP